jgi:ribosomal protein S26
MLAAGAANPILMQWHHYMITRIGLHMRSALTCACHTHLLRVSSDALRGMGVGTAINVCCADAERVEM